MPQDTPTEPSIEPKRLAVVALRLVASVALLALALWQIEGRHVAPTLRAADPWMVVAAVCVCGFSQYLSALRWGLLWRVANGAISVTRLLSHYLVGMFFGTLLPGVVSGDVVRIVRVAPHARGASEAAASVVLERLLGLIAMFAMGLGAIALNRRTVAPLELVAAYCLVGAVIFGFAFAALSARARAWAVRAVSAVRIRRLSSLAMRIDRAFGQYRPWSRPVLLAALLSLSIQLLNVLVYALLASALGLEVGVAFLFVFYPLVSVITMVPISIGGVGVREYSAATLFAVAGYDPGGAVALAIAWFGVISCWSILGGVLFAVSRRGA